MDQIKIGMFIAELRKEQGMTQRQLADSVGVSDKTISKWECGNGLPEMSSIPVLCGALGINMNELLSGERLAEETYSEKAEENMMTLMKETEEHKKKNKNSLITLVLCLVAVILALVLSLCFGLSSGSSVITAFLDVPSFLMLVVPTLLILVAAGMLKSFFKAFSILGSSEKYTKQQMEKSRLALRLGANSLLVVGALESVASVILLFGYYYAGVDTEAIFANVAVALLTMLYGMVAYLLLLPVRCRLEDVTEE